MIKITGRLDGENMIFTVTDDGKGMTKEVLEKLQESIGKEKGDKSIDGFGIGNVNRRIRYYYGKWDTGRKAAEGEKGGCAEKEKGKQ